MNNLEGIKLDKWCGFKIIIAKTDQGEMYYLVDESKDYNFIPQVKSYLDYLQARAQYTLSPHTCFTYCYYLRYYCVFLKLKKLNPFTITYDDLAPYPI